ncbi:MAG TPA: polysaccharide deacetylase family protein [Candidatus Cryosericum sp.]|nr:polysaccharide deacetylase family protein [Candidatus Cryosericum sp.]
MLDLKSGGELCLAWLLRFLGRLDARDGDQGGRGVILAYHRVLPRRLMPQFPLFEDLITPQESFDDQMGLLRRSACVLPLEDVIGTLRSGRRLPPRTVALTFDDGYADNFQFAFPVLRRHRLPATVFLATGYVGGKRGLFFWDEVSRWRSEGCHEVEVEGLGRRRIGRRRERDRLIQALKALPVDEITRRVGEAASRAGVRPSADAAGDFLTWDQVRQMQEGGIRFAAHTVSHCLLPRESPERRFEEVASSRKAVEAETGRPCTLFCYPDGAATAAVAREVEAAGYEGALVTGARDVVPGPGLDPFRIPRKCINYRAGMTVFRFRLSPHAERLKRLALPRREESA